MFDLLLEKAMAVNPKIQFLVAGILMFAASTHAATFQFVEDVERGRLTLKEGDRPVFVYNFGDQLAEGVDAKYTRSTYIHPLYDLDGQELTEDFPADHRHHHGLFWAWPKMKVRGVSTQTWHPDPANPLRQQFVRWVQRDVGEASARLKVENEWRFRGNETVATETVAMHIHPANGVGRAIDFSIRMEAVGGDIELIGRPHSRYGGLCARLAPRFRGKTLTTNRGERTEDADNEEFTWADISADSGLAIYASPDHPEFPPRWLLRTSYGGILAAHWPADKPGVLEPGQPVTLKYRLYIHRGNVETGKVKESYSAYGGKK